MKLAGEFSTTLEFGDSDVDAAIEWSAEDGELHYLEMSVNIAHIRLTKDGELAKTDDKYRVDWVDIQDHLTKAKQTELWDRCFMEAKNEVANYDPTPYEIDYDAESASERWLKVFNQRRGLYDY
jgi:hypothetical protein